MRRPVSAKRAVSAMSANSAKRAMSVKRLGSERWSGCMLDVRVSVPSSACSTLSGESCQSGRVALRIGLTSSAMCFSSENLAKTIVNKHWEFKLQGLLVPPLNGRITPLALTRKLVKELNNILEEVHQVEVAILNVPFFLTIQHESSLVKT